MISEGSCDTEDWSNDFYSIAVSNVFLNINAALVSIRDYLKLHKILKISLLSFFGQFNVIISELKTLI